MSDAIAAEPPLALPPGLRAALEQKARDKGSTMNAQLSAAVQWCERER